MVPAGSGLLTSLDIIAVDTVACLSDVVVSDPDANAVDFAAGDCVDLPVSCDDADADGICDDVDDCVGEYDECGVCNGDGVADGACDCDGNVEDCAGECGGDAVVDDCGVCDGDGTSCLENTLSFGAATENSLEILYDSYVDIGGFQFEVSGVDISADVRLTSGWYATIG